VYTITYEFVYRLIFYFSELILHKNEGAVRIGVALRIAFRRLPLRIAYLHYIHFFVVNTINHFPAAYSRFLLPA